MLEAATVAIQEGRLIIDTAAAQGVAPATVLARAGLAAGDLDDAEARLSREAFDRLVEHAVGLTGDVDLGLHAAERAVDGHRLPDALHYGLASCATIGDQFAMAARYARLLHANTEMTLATDASVARVTYDLPRSSAVARRHLAERSLGALVLLGRQADPGFAPRQVSFAHPATRDISEHERIFRAPPRFEQAVDAIVVDRAALDVRVRDGDPTLQRVLDAYLATILPEAAPPAVSDLVRRHIRASPNGHLPSVGSVAAALAMSSRTLQRHLAGERTSYQHVVAEVREDLARQYLSESRLSLSEIAFVLGFADVTSFHRAFKRWTGETPRDYQRRAAGHRASGAFGQHSGAQGQGSSPLPA